MNLYLVKAPGARRYAGSMGQARSIRTTLVEELNVQKRNVLIEQVVVGTNKEALLETLNQLCEELQSRTT